MCENIDKGHEVLLLHGGGVKDLLMVRRRRSVGRGVHLALVGDEAEGQHLHVGVMRGEALGDGAHAHAVHPQHGEHLELGHALVVGAPGHGEHPLVHCVLNTNLCGNKQTLCFCS